MLVDWLFRPLLIATPVIVGGIILGPAMRLGVLRQLAIPVSERLFGRNKTWRGFVLMPLCTVIGAYVATAIERALPPSYAVGYAELPTVALGVAIGLVFVAAELPNSYLKRRAGIAEGEAGTGVARWAFVVADQTDSVIACLAVVWLITDLPARLLLVTVIVATAAKIALNAIFYLTGIRRRVL